MQPSTYDFKKIKLIASGEKLSVKANQHGEVPGVTQGEYDNVPHLDLLSAVDSLRFHLPLLCDMVPESDAKTNTDLPNWGVTGFSVSGKPGQESVVITGYRKTYKNRVIAINSPVQRLQESEESPYPYLDELVTSMKKIGAEVRLYLFNAKKMDDAQGSFEFDADKATGAKILPPMTALEKAKQETVDAYNAGEKPDPLPTKPKPAGKKKVAQSAENKSGEVDA